mmetsp:Transcript_12122/g.35429  ORF Transcript_12122/g.35429 Transcript_12122/m.35429 type:complete len:237 (+) Transcript_12122:1893-2603(+)
MQPLPPLGVDVMLQGHGTVVGIHDMTRLMMYAGDPIDELLGIGDCGGEEDEAYAVREEDNGFLPDYATFFVSHVVHLIEDHPSHLPHHLAAPIQHAPQNLGRHDQTRRIRVNRNVPRHQPDVLKLLAQISKFLIRQRLNRRRVHHPLTIPQGFRNGILRDSRLSRRGVGRHQYTLALLDVPNRGFLERIELKRINLGGWPLLFLLLFISILLLLFLSRLFLLGVRNGGIRSYRLVV